jgi:hypothetical protein
VSFAGGCVFQATAERPTSGLSYLCGVAALFTGVKAETTETRSPDLEAASVIVQRTALRLFNVSFLQLPLLLRASEAQSSAPPQPWLALTLVLDEHTSPSALGHIGSVA